jgi:hypothetical protein
MPSKQTLACRYPFCPLPGSRKNHSVEPRRSLYPFLSFLGLRRVKLSFCPVVRHLCCLFSSTATALFFSFSTCPYGNLSPVLSAFFQSDCRADRSSFFAARSIDLSIANIDMRSPETRKAPLGGVLGGNSPASYLTLGTWYIPHAWSWERWSTTCSTSYRPPV